MEKIQTIEGLYDEKAEAVNNRINNRHLCFKHKWINAYLRWQERADGMSYWCIDFNHPGEKNTLIRYCSRCKKIDCMHRFNKIKTYIKEIDEFYHIEYSVGFCGCCKKRILLHSCGCCHPSETAVRLIEEVAEELNIDFLNCGSSYQIELPLEVSRKFAYMPFKDIKEFVKQQFLGRKLTFLK